MRGVIKGALSEEMENSFRMKKEYEEVLGKLPKGCLAARKIRGHEYYYLVKRIDKKVKYIYKGKLSEEQKKKYNEAKETRARYKKLLSQVKKQIRFLRSSRKIRDNTTRWA